MKIAVLWTFQTDYLMEALRHAVAEGNDVLLFVQDPDPNLPAASQDSSVPILSSPSVAAAMDALTLFQPDVTVIAGWHVPAYRKIASSLRGVSARVMAFDTQWRGTLRQRLGRAIFKIRWRSFYDWAFVPGERQFVFARKLGFESNRIHYGSIPANVPLFERYHETDLEHSERRSFLSVSRLVDAKGIPILLAAYEQYRSRAADPWELRIGGAGPVSVPDSPGIVRLGMLAPDDAAIEMARCGCFVSASVFEPWGVVLQEAAITGVPVIATEECGATGSMLLAGVNGIVVPTGDINALADAMIELSTLPATLRSRLGRNGIQISARSSPQKWLESLTVLAHRHVLSLVDPH